MFWIIFLIWLIGLIITNINLYLDFIDHSTGITIEDLCVYIYEHDYETLVFFSLFPIGGLITALITFFLVWPSKVYVKIKHIKIRR